MARVIVATRKYEWADGSGSIEVRWFKPVRSRRDYVCKYEVVGIGPSKLKADAVGVDSVQALWVAIEGARVLLEPIADELRFLGHPSLLLPRTFPFGFTEEAEARFVRAVGREMDHMLRAHGEDPEALREQERQFLLERRTRLLRLRKKRR